MAPTEADIATLRKVLPFAEVLTDESKSFADGTKAFSLQRDPVKGPSVIVRPRGTLDVVEAVKFARAHNLPFAVKGGGHSVAHLGIAKEGVTLDMSLMRSVHVDPVAKVAVADGGCLLGDIDRETSLYGLAVPMGHAPVTGMGLALGGGFGIATRLFGSTSHNILGVTLVKSDGSVVNVDEKSDPELLWAIRGAGAALGVVTKIKFQLHDVSDALTGLMMIPDTPNHSNWKAVAKFIRDEGIKEPGFSTPLMSAVTPDGTRLLVLMIFYLGSKSHEERQKFLQPLRDLGPIVDTVGKFKYVDTQFGMMDQISHMPPHYEYWIHGMTTQKHASEDFFDTYTSELMDGVPSDKFPVTFWLYDFYGEAMSQEDGPKAWANNSGKDMLWAVYLGYLDPSLHMEAKELSTKIKGAMSRFSSEEGYSNVMQDDLVTDDKLAVRVGGKSNLERLRAVKRRVDPDNLFTAHPLTGL